MSQPTPATPAPKAPATSAGPVKLPFNLREWVEEHRKFLRPPVGNRQIFRESADFIVMAVGGPNARSDYHDDPGEEVFYQLEGAIVLKTLQNGIRVDIPIREGEMLLLPAHIPHSPQRPANTVGLVIERVRRPEEQDGFLWFCERCSEPLYQEYFHVSNIETQLPPVFERFHGTLAHRTCKRCGHVHPLPA